MTSDTFEYVMLIIRPGGIHPPGTSVRISATYKDGTGIVSNEIVSHHAVGRRELRTLRRRHPRLMMIPAAQWFDTTRT